MKTRDEILAFYRDFPRVPSDEDRPLRDFVTLLLRERPLDGCTFFTSHGTLGIVRYSPYQEWVDKPTLFVGGTGSGRLKVAFRITLSIDPVYRTLTEEVVCNPDIGLSMFDRLYSKFLAAHDEPQPGGDAGQNHLGFVVPVTTPNR